MGILSFAKTVRPGNTSNATIPTVQFRRVISAENVDRSFWTKREHLNGRSAYENAKRLRERRTVFHGGIDVRKRQEQQQRSWTTKQDKILRDYRARGYEWVQIQLQHFPGRTANACRNRHEELTQQYLQQQEKGSGNKHAPGLVINASTATSLQAKVADGNSSPRNVGVPLKVPI
jgi:hypothetical protein